MHFLQSTPVNGRNRVLLGALLGLLLSCRSEA